MTGRDEIASGEGIFHFSVYGLWCLPSTPFNLGLDLGDITPVQTGNVDLDLKLVGSSVRPGPGPRLQLRCRWARPNFVDLSLKFNTIMDYGSHF